MKMSSTKPMKNTMRKPSPLKFMGTNPAMATVKKVSDAASAVKAAKAKKATMPEGKPGTTAIKITKTTKATKSPAMQMKKSGMGKKC